ncbi:IclR family transcriptional regulator [Hephaestia sp. GCM10023244]|uniref:IclR family transcriptional regulator n=1 Tax=unclassified Hephaestia TaxID=2631281 RepID=UPI002077942B|nr:IclR family transcriptional regulator [Hephaestia sp. MAHUQ-44]MCM8732263.1 IclR family transcriptional regulator [Hephaestia sp. MAHUQ-44]
MEATERSRRRVQSIEVGFRVLRVLRMADGPLPLREIAARAGMPTSKAHLYLVSFVYENMAYQDLQTGYYGLGSFAIQLGLAAIRQLDVVTLASTAMTELRDQTDCAIYLTLWGDRGPCIVAKADGTLQGAFSVRLGYILPLTTSATGFVFLAHLPQYETERALEAQRAYDATRKDAPAPIAEDFAENLEKIRQDGYASTVGMLNRNFAAIAAPVFDYSNRIAATMTLLGPSDYLGRTRQKELRKLLLNATQSVSQRMGAAGAGKDEAQER